MSSGPEKVQQVQQQQPDTQGRQFAAEFRETADLQKNRVQETEQGSQSGLIEDKKELNGKKQQREKRKKQRSPNGQSLSSESISASEVTQGKLVDITI